MRNKQTRDNYEAKINITKVLQNDFNWWCININKAENKVSQFKPVIEIFSGASTSG